MKYQSLQYKCGPGAIRNALRALGTKLGEDTISAACGTDEGGTDDYEIIAGIRSFGFSANEFSSLDKRAAWDWLHGCLLHGKVVILCVEAWEHWVVAIGSNGDRVVIIDSSNFKYNKAENGTHVWSKKHLMNKWWNARRSVEGENRLYAIAVGRKK